MVYKYALATDIIEQFDTQTEAFPDGTLKREMSVELMDLIESEFFAGALYELCTASFNSTVQRFLVDKLNQSMPSQKRKSSAALLQVPGIDAPVQAPDEPRIAVVQLTTIFYQLQNSDLI